MSKLLPLLRQPYEFIDWYIYDASQTIPFTLTFKMPPTARGKRGYLDRYAAKLQKQLMKV